MRIISIRSVWFCALLLLNLSALGQNVTLTGRVAWIHSGKLEENHHSAAGVVVWLAPAGDAPEAPDSPAAKPQLLRLNQKNKTFEPHLLVVPVGSAVVFPNHDPFFHNVFSLFEGKRFDLGLYEAGSTREVQFNKPGISYIFCNIHPEMSAVIIAVPTHSYAISDAQGQVVMSNVPVGQYSLHFWYEGAGPEELEAGVREVTVSVRNSNIGVLRLKPAALTQAHKNKYGRDYDPPAPNSPGYERP